MNGRAPDAKVLVRDLPPRSRSIPLRKDDLTAARAEEDPDIDHQFPGSKPPLWWMQSTDLHCRHRAVRAQSALRPQFNDGSMTNSCRSCLRHCNPMTAFRTDVHVGVVGGAGRGEGNRRAERGPRQAFRSSREFSSRPCEAPDRLNSAPSNHQASNAPGHLRRSRTNTACQARRTSSNAPPASCRN